MHNFFAIYFFLLLWPISITAQELFFETGTGLRVGTWQYNLGNNTNGDFAGNGLQYTHFSPYLPVYAQIGYSWDKFEIGMGSSFTLFMDNEMRVHQNPGAVTVDEYAFTDGTVMLFNAYLDVKYFLISKSRFKLGPRFSGGYFTPLTDYPEQERLNNSWFLEGGMSSLFQIKTFWINISPSYQWNTIRATNTSAEHQLFSFGALVGIRWLLIN